MVSISLIHQCSFKKCKNIAIYKITLENGKEVAQSCELHKFWAKRLAKEIENS